MGKFSQKIELTANIFIIIVAVVFGVVLVQKYLFTSVTATKQARVQPTENMKKLIN